jgi:hypothetical protein
MHLAQNCALTISNVKISRSAAQQLAHSIIWSKQ